MAQELLAVLCSLLMYIGRNVDHGYLLENRYAKHSTQRISILFKYVVTSQYRHTTNLGHHRSEPENINELSSNPISGSTNHSSLLG